MHRLFLTDKDMFQTFIGVAGGLAIFLYGMNRCSEGLQRASGSALKAIIHRLTSHPLMGVVVGAVVTVLIQSSSATTVILVGLVGASLMTLKQSIGVILGADVGTTLTVQLIAFNVTNYSLLIIALGFAIRSLAKRKRYRYLGQIVFGFGLIFFGMGIMSQSMEPLKNYPGAADLFLSFGTRPLFGVLVAALFTALIQGSAATIGIVLSLSVQGLIPLEAAIPLILGANIGTCATALLSTIGSSTEAKRVGYAHVLFKVLGVVVLLPFIGPFTSVVALTSTAITRQIANAHTLFNVGITVLFLPFSAQFAELVKKLAPDRDTPKIVGKPQFLNPKALDTPLVALEQAKAEVLGVAKLIDRMMINVGLMFLHRDDKIKKETDEMESAVDRLYKEIIVFLSDVSEHDLSNEQSRYNLFLIQVINDLEHMGDLATRMSRVLTEKVHEGVAFSHTGQTELLDFHRSIQTLVGLTINVLDHRRPEDIQYLLTKTQQAIIDENRLRISHIRRLQARVEVSRDSSSVHLDLINCLRRIAEHVDLIGKNAATGLGQIELPLLEEGVSEKGKRAGGYPLFE